MQSPELFRCVGGSIVGRDHRLVAKNNQDAWAFDAFGGITVAVVADGCGSGAHSEVGAALGVKLLLEAFRREYRPGRAIAWSRIQQRIVSQIDVLVAAMAGSYRQIIEEYFLFTLVGIVIEPRTATYFACGDGAIACNDIVYRLGPFPGNMPPYIGYALLASELTIDPTTVALAPVMTIETEQLESFMVGTDGVDDLVACEGRRLPGLQSIVGPVSDFWSDDRYFGGNPALLSRQLKLIGRDWPQHEPEPGLLHDDTTMIVGRRSRLPEEA